jgi:tetratricopeptide (TPR) repeat protein
MDPIRLRSPARRAAAAALALGLAAACTTPLEIGERRYREGDRLAALESWREIGPDSPYHDAAQRRIAQVEDEFEQLVVRYKKRGRYYERKERLAESVLNYRLALKLQPDDRETLEHVQQLARALAARRAELMARYREAMAAGDLALARSHVEALATLDPFDADVAAADRQLEGALGARVERLLVRGRRGYSSGNHDAAERAFRAVLELDPENASAQGYLSFIARIRAEERREERPAPVAARHALPEPDEVEATPAQIRAEGFYQNALSAERAGDAFGAIRFDVEALGADPAHGAARSHLADLRRRLAPGIPELVEAGRVAYQEEDLQSALDQWRRVLLIDPGHAQTRDYVARAERLLENLERLRADSDPGAG